MSTTTDLTTLKINYLTQAQYDAALEDDEINADEIYMTPVGTVGTVTSVGVSNATNGGLSISGSPITSSGTITVGHSNVLSSAQTTQAIYPIKIDKNGHVSQYGSAFNLKSEVLDMFYPVGSYYETSDTTFNPNTAWGGTWLLETAGYVHVSAGTNYSVNHADDISGGGTTVGAKDGGADQIVYTPSGSTANVKLSDEQIAHGHTHTNPTVTTPTLTASSSNFVTSASAAGSSQGTITSSSSSNYNYMRVAHSSANVGKAAPSIAAGKSCTVSGGSVGNLSGASSTRTTHTHAFTGTQAQLDNMQPYIVVNRWHRTA